MKIEKRIWGSVDGREAWLFEMECGQMRACVSNYGGLLQSLVVKGRDVVLGYDSLEEYRASETFFGAMVGPIADRLYHGSCTIDGVRVQLECNAGPDCMHSGAAGFHARLWDWELLEDGVKLLGSFFGEENPFPGRMDVELRYRIRENALRLEYAATCDREFAASFTNHSYFNLDSGENHCRDHVLTLCADVYAPTRRECEPICTGESASVEGTPFDLRSGCPVGDVIARENFREVRTGGGIDHYFPIRGEGMRLHAVLESPKSGLRMECRSDAPGVLVYSANGLEDEPGKGARRYGRNWGICLETECFPNAVNFPGLRSQAVHPAHSRYESATEFIFA